jgi:hypothetical protein
MAKLIKTRIGLFIVLVIILNVVIIFFSILPIFSTFAQIMPSPRNLTGVSGLI